MDLDQAAQTFGGVALGFLALIALFAVVSLLLTIFWVWMLVDCANSPLPTSDKTAWILIMLSMSILGAILYYFIPRLERLRMAPRLVATPPPPV